MPTVRTARAAPPRRDDLRLSALRAPAPKAKKLRLGSAAAGFVLVLGAAAAGAAWIGGSLFDARQVAAGAADVLAAHVGFRLKAFQVEGVSGARSEEVRRVALAAGRLSLLAADPRSLKARIEALPWVRAAHVTRLWPSTIRVRIERREAYALVQRAGVAAVVDADGRPAMDARIEDLRTLPLLVGAGALEAAPSLLPALEEAPELRARAHALIRVGRRRWDVELRSGLRVLLPEAEPERALTRIEGLHALHGLLDQPIARVDMRHPGELVVLPGPPASAAPAEAPADVVLRREPRVAKGA